MRYRVRSVGRLKAHGARSATVADEIDALAVMVAELVGDLSDRLGLDDGPDGWEAPTVRDVHLGVGLCECGRALDADELGGPHCRACDLPAERCECPPLKRPLADHH